MSEAFPFSRTAARISLAAIEKNFLTLKNSLQDGVKTMAVVKANAYGHGAIPVAKKLEPLCDSFAVACAAEALELREGGIEKPILILSYSHPSLYETLIQQNVTLTLFSAEEAVLLSEVALRCQKRAKVHLAVDTGMGRIGVTPDDQGVAVAKAMASLEGIELEGVFSHYACADQVDKEDALLQTALFDAFLQKLTENGISVPLKHICNSAGSMDFTRQYDLCRLGIALYGLYPSDEMNREKHVLTPAMEVLSRVVHVKTVPAGFSIGYGHIYTAPSPKRIATVAIGYADGFNRCLTERGFVLIHGKKAPLCGKVCMDQIMVDVSEIPEVAVGDEVVILGKSGEAEITADEFGALCHSFNYEVVCTFMPRVERIYEN